MPTESRVPKSPAKTEPRTTAWYWQRSTKGAVKPTQGVSRGGALSSRHALQSSGMAPGGLAALIAIGDLDRADQETSSRANSESPGFELLEPNRSHFIYYIRTLLY